MATSTHKLNKYACKIRNKLVHDFGAETPKLTIFLKKSYFSLSNNGIKIEKK